MAVVVRVRVFGGLQLWRSGIEVDVGSVRAQTVLAVLLAAQGAAVSASALIDALWGEHPPATATNQLQRLIGQVRRLFEPELPNREPGSWLLPVGEGYRLRQDRRSSDLLAFHELAAEAQAAADRADGPGAAQRFEQALLTAQGMPFAGLPTEVLALPAFVAIEDALTEVAVRAADLAITEPRAHRLLPLLSARARAAPFHEPLQARLIRVLTAADRRSEALTHFEAVRHQLSDALGADPGAELQAAHLEALTDPQARHQARPAQLPLRVAAFSPRDDLVDALSGGRDAAVIVLSGMGGAGKTAMAVDWAHRIAGDYPDGQLYLDLRGFGPGGRHLRSAEALTTLLLTMGVAPAGDDDPDALAAQFRSTMVGRRMIVVLDNARDSAQVRPLLPATEGCLVLVTSRNRMPSLVAREGAWPVHVGRLNHRTSKDLLALRLGVPRLVAEPAAADRLVELCAGLPLALSIAAARIAISPDESLADAVAELEPAARRLDGLETGEEHDSVRSAFSWSYQVLAEPSARLFRLLAVHPGTEVAADAAASIAGSDVRASMTELTVTSMVTRSGAGQYSLHDLLHTYAAELLSTGVDDRLGSERRLVDHYLHASRNAYSTFKMLALPDPGPVPDGVFPPRPPEGFEAALTWYERERTAVLGVVDLALQRGWVRAAALIILNLRAVRSVRLESSAEIRRQAALTVDAVADLDDPELESLMLREAAVSWRWTDLDRAHQYLLRALAIVEDRDDLLGLAQILRNLASSPRTPPPEQLTYAGRAVAVARRAGDPSVLAFALHQLGISMEDHGDLAGAAIAVAESYEVTVEHGLRDLQITVAMQRAWIAFELGDTGLAVPMAEWALANSPPADTYVPFTATLTLVKAYHRSGDAVRTRTAAAQFHDLVARHATAYSETFGAERLAEFVATVDAAVATR